MRPLVRLAPADLKNETYAQSCGTYVKKQDAFMFRTYQKAMGALVSNFGRVCAYCEAPISGAIPVEHKAAKSGSGSLCDWSNLLIACVSCNTYKGTQILDWDPEQQVFWNDFYYDYNTSHTEIFVDVRVDSKNAPAAEAFIQKLHLNDRGGINPSKEMAVVGVSVLPRRRAIVRRLAKALSKANVPPTEMVEYAYSTGFWTLWVETLIKHSRSARWVADILIAFSDGRYFPGTNLKMVVDSLIEGGGLDNPDLNLPNGAKVEDVKVILTKKWPGWRDSFDTLSLPNVTAVGGIHTQKGKAVGTPTKTIQDGMQYAQTPESTKTRDAVSTSSPVPTSASTPTPLTHSTGSSGRTSSSSSSSGK